MNKNPPNFDRIEFYKIYNLTDLGWSFDGFNETKEYNENILEELILDFSNYTGNSFANIYDESFLPRSAESELLMYIYFNSKNLDYYLTNNLSETYRKIKDLEEKMDKNFEYKRKLIVELSLQLQNFGDIQFDSKNNFVFKIKNESSASPDLERDSELIHVVGEKIRSYIFNNYPSPKERLTFIILHPLQQPTSFTYQ